MVDCLLKSCLPCSVAGRKQRLRRLKEWSQLVVVLLAAKAAVVVLMEMLITISWGLVLEVGSSHRPCCYLLLVDCVAAAFANGSESSGR